jgi:type IV secretion system protein VirD4
MSTWSSEGRLAVLAGIGAALILTMWLAGQIGALMEVGHSLEAGPGDAAAGLLGLPFELNNPRAAWPRELRPDLPAAAGFYLALVIATAIVAAVAFAALTLASRAGLLTPTRTGGRAAHWARPGDLRALTVQGPTPRRVTLGRVGGRLVAAEELHSALVVAPTGMGKTAGLVVPAILEWQGPVVACSVTTDLVRDTFMRRNAVGDVNVFDPDAASGLPRSTWSPLRGAADWRGAREQAQRLITAAYSARGVQETDVLAQQAVRYLAPLLLAAARDGRTMGDVLLWVQTGEQQAVVDALGGEELAPAELEDDLRAGRAALDSARGGGETLSTSVRATVEEALDPYGEPTVLASAHGSDINPTWLLDGSNTLYLYGTARAQERLRPLFVTLLDEIVTEVHERSARTGRPIDPPLLLVLDAAASAATPPDLARIAAGGRGQGLQLLTVLQDLQQADRRWRGEAETIVNNHRAKVFGAGVSDTRTVDYVSRLLGEEQVKQVSLGMTRSGESGSRSRTQSTSWRTLAPANVLREAPDGTAILVYGNLPPARLELRPWFREESLRELAHARPASSPRVEAASE